MESKIPMSKKNIVGAAVVVLLAAYGGATWYMGESARKHYEEALEEAKGFLGPQAVGSHQYERGFWTSHAKLVLQWSPPAAADVDDAAVPPPIRIAVDSTLRHGPLDGSAEAALGLVEGPCSIVQVGKVCDAHGLLLQAPRPSSASILSR